MTQKTNGAHQAIPTRHADGDDAIRNMSLNLTRAAHACKVATKLASPSTASFPLQAGLLQQVAPGNTTLSRRSSALKRLSVWLGTCANIPA